MWSRFRVAAIAGLLAWLAWSNRSVASDPGRPRAPQAAPSKLAEPAEMPRAVVPAMPELDPVEVAGLAPGSHPYALTLQDAYTLALARARENAEGQAADRAVIRDAKQLAERLSAARRPEFTRFSALFLANPPGEGAAQKAFDDPGPEFLELIGRLQIIENEQATIGALERVYELSKDLVKGEPSGLSQLQVDQTDLMLQQARFEQKERIVRYREALDDLKVELGLAPDLPVIPDRSPLAAFHDFSVAVRRWIADPKRELHELDMMLSRVPEPEDVPIDGRQVLDTIRNHPEQLEALLEAAAASRAAQQDGRPKAAVAEKSTLVLRKVIRQFSQAAELNQVNRRYSLLEIRRLDNAMEGLLSPPSRTARRNGAGVAGTLVQTLSVLDAERSLVARENALVQSWVLYERGRLLLYRGLGRLPYKDWASYLKSLTATSNPPAPRSPAAR